MPDFAIVQAAARTGSIGTQDFTVSGFGTPKGAIFLVGRAIALNTTVASGVLTMGFTDGTTSGSVGSAWQDAVAGSNCASMAQTRLITVLDASGANIGDASSSDGGRAVFSTWITDGIRVDWTTVPANAVLVTCILIGGSGVSNVAVLSSATPSTVDTATDITTVGFQPDLVIAAARETTSVTSNLRDLAQAGINYGVCTRAGSNPHPQFALSIQEPDATNPTAPIMHSDSAMIIKQAAGSARAIELRDFDSSGFSAFLRNATGTAYPFLFMAIKFSGLSAKILQTDSPTATGSHSISGAGFTPQFGMMFQSALTSWDAATSTDAAEVFGVSAFTAAAQYCHAITTDDNVATSNIDSHTSDTPVKLIKDGSTLMAASFTGFTSDGATFNYTTADASARKRIALFVSNGANSPPMFRGS
jgi:hypothetical protein